MVLLLLLIVQPMWFTTAHPCLLLMAAASVGQWDPCQLLLSNGPALCQTARGTSCCHVSTIPGHVCSVPGHVGTLFGRVAAKYGHAGSIPGHVGSIWMPDKLPWWCRARRKLQRPCESLWTTTTTLCWSIAYTARTGLASLSCSSCCSAVWNQRYRFTVCVLTIAMPYPVDMLGPRHGKLHPAPSAVYAHACFVALHTLLVHCVVMLTPAYLTKAWTYVLDRRLGKSCRLCAFADSCAGLCSVRNPLEEL